MPVPVEFMGSHFRELRLIQKTIFNMTEKHISTVKWYKGWWVNKNGVIILWHILNTVWGLLNVSEIWGHGSCAENPFPVLPPMIFLWQGSLAPQSYHLPLSSSAFCFSLMQEWIRSHRAQPRGEWESRKSPHALLLVPPTWRSSSASREGSP